MSIKLLTSLAEAIRGIGSSGFLAKFTSNGVVTSSVLADNSGALSANATGASLAILDSSGGANSAFIRTGFDGTHYWQILRENASTGDFLLVNNQAGTVKTLIDISSAGTFLLGNTSNIGTVIIESKPGQGNGPVLNFNTNAVLKGQIGLSSGMHNTTSTDIEIAPANGSFIRFVISNVPIYANNAAALAGGLVQNNLYRTGGDPDTICIVH